MIKKLFCVLAFLFVTGLSPIAFADDGSSPFDGLCKKLTNDGFDQAVLAEYYGRPQVKFDLSVAMVYFRHRESKLNYGQFSEDSAIASARQYIVENSASLEKAQKAYGVDKETITAILLVETRLGKLVGKKRVFNTLSSLSALSDKKNRDALWKQASKKDGNTRSGLDKWAARKSNWAYKELKAFLTYVNREKANPVEIKGSFAGALGYSQFIPSSVLSYGKDGNGDGKINLFEHPDAIASIGNYLKSRGWKPGMDKEAMAKVLLTYNNSKYYVDALLNIRDILRNKS